MTRAKLMRHALKERISEAASCLPQCLPRKLLWSDSRWQFP